jgi:hypothetical protein
VEEPLGTVGRENGRECAAAGDATLDLNETLRVMSTC